MTQKKLTIQTLTLALLFGLLFWLFDSMASLYYFNQNLRRMMFEPPENLLDALFFNISAHTLFVRLSFLFTCLIGGLIAAYYISSRRKFEQHRNVLDKAIAEISNQFIATEGADYHQILRILGECVHVNRAYIFQFRDNGRKLDNTFEWCAWGTEPQKDMLQDMSSDMFSWWIETLQSGEHLIVKNVAELPPEAAVEKELLQAQHIRSLIVVPILLKDRTLWGFMGFDDTEKPREWEELEAEILGVVSDMFTSDLERSRAQEALRLKNFVFDASIAANSTADTQGIINEANSSFLKIWGYAHKDEVIGRPISDFLQNEQEAIAIVNALNKTGLWEGEYTARRKDGSTFMAYGLATVLRDTHDTMIGYQSSVIDITERKRAEQEIESLAKFPSENPNPVLRVDRNGLLLYANEAAFSVLSDWKLQTGQTVPEVLQELTQEKKEQPVRMKDIPHGKCIFSFAASYSPDAEYINMYARNITERKQAEKVLQEYSEKLEAMVEERTRELQDAQEKLLRQEKLAALGQLAGSIAHELRHPLGVLSNAAYFLKMSLPDANETIREYLEMMTTEIQKSDKIISDLLDFSRNQLMGKLTKTETRISEIITEVLAEQPPPADVELTLESSPELPPIFVDAQHIQQVLTNLVNNAYQAMSEGGQLTITTEVKEPHLLVSIADTGCGISPEHLNKVFEPLFTTKAKGIGLGLAITKNLVESNGGSIEVESEEGKGATFTIALALNQEEE